MDLSKKKSSIFLNFYISIINQFSQFLLDFFFNSKTLLMAQFSTRSTKVAKGDQLQVTKQTTEGQQTAALNTTTKTISFRFKYCFIFMIQ
jgi:hypothetical protein